MLALLIGAAAFGGGFVATRDFVRRRLPIALLPLVTVWTAAAFGVGVAGGVASGRRAPELPPGS